MKLRSKKVFTSLIVIVLLVSKSIISNAAEAHWIKVGPDRIYQQDGKIKTGWIKDDEKWYFLDDCGIMQKGWIFNNNKWYFLCEEGFMVTGWMRYKDRMYHLNENGSMSTGWINSKGAWYYLSKDGSMAVNTSIDGHWVNSAGVREDTVSSNNDIPSKYIATKVPKILETTSLNSMEVGAYNKSKDFTAITLKLGIANIKELAFSEGKIKDIYYTNKNNDKVYFRSAQSMGLCDGGLKVKLTLEKPIKSGFEEGFVTSTDGSSVKIHDTLEPTFCIVKVKDKDGNGCIDEVKLKFNEAVVINNLLSFELQGGGKSCVCSSFYINGDIVDLKFEYLQYGNGNNVPMDSSHIKVTYKTHALENKDGMVMKRKPTVDINGNALKDGYSVYYR